MWVVANPADTAGHRGVSAKFIGRLDDKYVEIKVIGSYRGTQPPSSGTDNKQIDMFDLPCGFCGFTHGPFLWLSDRH
jgi:hypothetical protein